MALMVKMVTIKDGTNGIDGYKDGDNKVKMATNGIDGTNGKDGTNGRW